MCFGAFFTSSSLEASLVGAPRMLSRMKYILQCAYSSLLWSPNSMSIECHNCAEILLFQNMALDQICQSQSLSLIEKQTSNQLLPLTSSVIT